MGRFFVLAGLLFAFSAAPAWAGNVATPLMGEVASWAAGKPLAVHCESDDVVWYRMVEAAFGGPRPNVQGFTRASDPKIWLSPQVCSGLTGSKSGRTFGPALVALLHESVTHRGFRAENAQQCAAVVLHYDALRRFFGVPFFSPLARSIDALVLAQWAAMPVQYRGCPL